MALKRFALGAAIGTGVGIVLDRLHVTRRSSRPEEWTEPEDAWSSGAGATVSDSGPVSEAQTTETVVDPDQLTSPGTVDDPRLEEQRAREAVERERESRLSDETKYDELRRQEAESDAARVVGDVPAPRDEE